MASFTTMASGRCRVLIRRKALGTICKSFATEDLARSWAEAEEARLLRTVLEKPATAAGSITLREAWEGYEKSIAFRKTKAASTQRRERQAASVVLRHMGGLSLNAVDRPRIQHFIDKRSTEKHARGKDRKGRTIYVETSGDTVHREKEVLSAIFRWAMVRNYVNGNPTKGGLEMPACNVREARITPEQENALENAAWDYCTPKGKGRPANPNIIPWLGFTFATGTRPGEAAKIELSWVNLPAREIRIPRLGHKTRNPRIILLTDEVARLVQYQIDYATQKGSKYLFFSMGRKGGFKPYQYSKPWAAICERAGVPSDVTPHAMRREFISRLMEHTRLSDTQVAMLVGDVHPLSLRPYAHLRANVLRPDLADFEQTMLGVKREVWGNERAAGEVSELIERLTRTK